MIAKRGSALLSAALLLLGLAPALRAQDPASQQQTTDQQDKDKPTPEKKAYSLLDQVIDEAGGLKLPENRVFIQISAADLLWDKDEARARVLFGEAGAGIADMLRRSDPNDRRSAMANRAASELRQQLVLTVAKHNGDFAYQLLQTMPASPAPPQGPGGGRSPNSQSTLEQSLVAAIAANDPKTALKNAQGWLDKGEYPASLSKVLSQLQSKDPDSANKLADQVAKKLSPEELLAKPDAVRLSLSLLRTGPRTDSKSTDAQSTGPGSDRYLAESGYRDVMSAAITAALRATPQPPSAQGRGTGGGFRGGPNAARGTPQTPPTEADIAQTNARMLLTGLQGLQSQIDQYLPEKSLALRQKISQMGMDNSQRTAFSQMAALMQQGTSDSLMAAAAAAPQGMQNRLYQQAAMKALDEGNADRAREIANQHFEGTAQANLLRQVELQQAVNAAPNKPDDIRQIINKAQNDDERLSLLLQFAANLQAQNPKMSLQLLDEARALVSKKATSYGQFEAQINVAQAYASIDPAKSFETLEPGINQINELLSAASILSGFEVNIFKDGELPLRGGGSLSGLVTKYGTELAALAKLDFEKAQSMSERFQLAEPRILARLTIIRGLLGVPQTDGPQGGFGSFNRGGGRRN